MKDGYRRELRNHGPEPTGSLLNVHIGEDCHSSAPTQNPSSDASAASKGESSTRTPKKYLGVRFVDCNAYGRMYPNFTGTHFVGRCPKCGRTVRARIGSDGTNARFFQASCEKQRNGETQPCWPTH